MDYAQREELAMTGDTSKTAISVRIRAARKAAGYRQKELAATVGITPQTYHSQESSGSPSIAVMRHLYRAHRIDFNFILHGDFAQLPGDVQQALFDALSAP